MNHISISKNKNLDDPTKIELTISDEIEDMIMQPLKQEWLMAILNGERRSLDNGMTYYSFRIPIEDAELLKEAFIQAYTKITGYNTSN